MTTAITTNSSAIVNKPGPVDGIAFGLELEMLVKPPARGTNGPQVPLTPAEIAKAGTTGFNKEKDVNDLRAAGNMDLAKGVRELESAEVAKWLIKRYAPWSATAGLNPPAMSDAYNESKGERDFGAWQLTHDSSIVPLLKNGSNVDPQKEDNWDVSYQPPKYPMEIISPILRTDLDFSKEIQAKVSQNISSVYTFLQAQQCQIEVNASCSTHVHVSCKGARKWSWEDARRVALAARFWESVIDLIIGEARTTSKYCLKFEPLVFDPSKMNLLKEWTRRLWQPDMDVNAFLTLVNPRPRSAGFMSGGSQVNRYYRWNFTNLLIMGQPDPLEITAKDVTVKQIGTIEFRGPPGSGTAAEAVKWAEFTTRFVAAAMNKDQTYYPNTAVNAFANNKKSEVRREFLKFCGLNDSWFPELNKDELFLARLDAITVKT